MKLEIIGEPNLDFYSDLQKLAIKHKVAIMTMQQKKKKSFLSMKDIWIKICYGNWRTE